MIEAELHERPLRDARVTREGLRTLLLSFAPIGAALLAVAWLYFSQDQPWWVDGLCVLFGLTACAILARLIVLWLNRRALVKRGVPVAAVVVWKEQSENGQARYYAWYTAESRQWGLGWTAAETDAEVGDAVTVLHRAGKPGEAVVYRWAGYSAR